MKRITKAALGGIAGGALILAATQTATGLSPILNFFYSDEVVDLPVKGPFDAASADLAVKVSGDGTNFRVDFRNIEASAAGQEFGAHLHVGECDSTDASKAGGHYNREVVVDGVPAADAEVNPRTTEVWFDLRPNAHGDATDEAFHAFRPVDPDGAMSIVVHVDPTDPKTGAAGFRQACFPVDVSKWAPRTP